MTTEARPRRDYEAEADIDPFMRRMLRALVRRSTAGELEALEVLYALERVVGSSIVAAAQGAHEGPAKYSWGEIGRWLGMSRQAAHQRFTKEARNG